MSYELKQNTGTLFKTDAEKGKKYAMNGKININGKKYLCFGYKNTIKSSGEKYLGLTFLPLDEDQPLLNQPINVPAIPDGDLPF